ncbi:MAG: hypothetical protein ACP5RC_09050 [Halothiobacillaceae bacterium]
MSDITHHTDYRRALAAIKQRIQTSQTRMVRAVNVPRPVGQMPWACAYPADYADSS